MRRTDETEETSRLLTERDAARRALAEALAFIQDINNTQAPAVVAWHERHAATVLTAARQFGCDHLLAQHPAYAAGAEPR